MAWIFHLFFNHLLVQVLMFHFPLFLGRAQYRVPDTNTPRLPENEDPDPAFVNWPRICFVPRKGSTEQKIFRK